MTNARRLGVACASFALILAPACSITADDGPHYEAETDVPFDLLEAAPPGTAPNPPGSDGVSTRVCLLGADEAVHPVDRSLAPGYRMVELVEVLTAGPTETERSFGLTTALAEPGTVPSIDVQQGVATVDLDRGLASRPAADQLTVVTQLVCTLTEQPGIGQVRFTVDGAPIVVPRGDGSSSSDPVSRHDYASLIAST